MKLQKLVIHVFLVIIITNISYSHLYAQKGLRGLDLSRLSLAATSIVPKKYGITSEMLKAFIAEELKKKGLKGLDITKSGGEEDPFFFFFIFPVSCGEECLLIQAKVADYVCLTRNLQITFLANVWESNFAFPILGTTESILNMVSRILDDFVRAYNGANK